jgi:hypothetical protein
VWSIAGQQVVAAEAAAAAAGVDDAGLNIAAGFVPLRYADSLAGNLERQ